MKIQIKNRYAEKVILEGEAETLKDFLEANRETNLWRADLQEAGLQEADLREAGLQEADLREADLQGADLHGANLQEAKIKITQQIEIIKGMGIIVEK